MAPLVIANADPAHVLGGLVEGAHAPRLAPSMSGWTAIVRARRRPRAAHTVLYSGDYDAELRDIFDSARAPLRPTIYVCAQEPAHGRHGWEDDEPLFVMTNAPPEPASGASELAWWERTRVEVSARLRASGVTSEGDRVLWERGPRELAAAFPGTRGALYGSGSSSMASAFLRPSNEVRSVPGLFLASGGAHPGGGMPLATLSGVEAARAATAFLARAS